MQKAHILTNVTMGGMLFVISLLCIIFIAPAVFAADYYVWGGTGSDGNSGNAMTQSQAWATLAHADDMVGPGDTVYIKGTFNSEQNLNNSSAGNGTSWENPVTYVVYDNNDVAFNPNNTNVLSLRLQNKSYVIFNGNYQSNKRVLLYGSGQDLQINNSSYIKFTGARFNPSGQTPNTGDSTIKIYGSSQYVYLYGNEIRNAGTAWNSECIYIGAYQNNYSVDHVYIYNNSFTLEAIESEPQALDVKAYNGTDIKFYGNTIDSRLAGGYAPISISSPIDIYDNTIDISEQASPGKNAIVYFNMNGGYSPSNCTVNVYRNVFIGGTTNEAVATFVSSWPGLNFNLYNNIIRDFKDGYILDFDRGGSKSLGTIRLYHNTFFNCLLDGNIDSSGSTATIIAKNNLFNDWDKFAFTDTTNLRTTMNGNAYFRSGVTDTDGVFIWNGINCSFTTLRKNDGQETNGQFGIEPNLDENGRLLSPLSALLDVSSEMKDLPDFNKDIDGKVREYSWDAGASQHGDTAGKTLLPPTGLHIVGGGSA